MAFSGESSTEPAKVCSESEQEEMITELSFLSELQWKAKNKKQN